jgi:hypothetical protein
LISVPLVKLADIIIADRRDACDVLQRGALAPAQTERDNLIGPSGLWAAHKKKLLGPWSGEKKEGRRLESTYRWPKEGVTEHDDWLDVSIPETFLNLVPCRSIFTQPVRKEKSSFVFDPMDLNAVPHVTRGQHWISRWMNDVRLVPSRSQSLRYFRHIPIRASNLFRIIAQRQENESETPRIGDCCHLFKF